MRVLQSPTAASGWVQVGAFLPRDPDVAQRLRDQQHAVPLLMVHGSSDMLVPLERRHAAQQKCGAGSCCRGAAACFICMTNPACAPAYPASLPAAEARAPPPCYQALRPSVTSVLPYQLPRY